MRKFYTFVVPLIALYLAACGGSDSDPSAQAFNAVDGGSPKDLKVLSTTDDGGALMAMIDGVAWRGSSKVKNRSLHFKSEKLLLILESPLTRDTGPLGASFSISLEKANLKTGSFSFIPRIRSADKNDPEVVLIKIQGEDKFPGLTSKQGTLELSQLETQLDENGAHRVTQVQGTFTGTFRTEEGTEHQVSGSIRFAPQ